METDRLIAALAGNVRPVRRLASPGRRVWWWVLPSLAAVSVVVAVSGLRPDLSIKLADPRFAVQVLAALATALGAAFAACCAGVPGEARWKLWVPVVPLALWLGSLGEQCWQEWLRAAAAAALFQLDPICIPAIAATGAVPAAAMAVTLRRGAPLRPRLSVALGALAAAALADAGLRLFHPQDAALTVIVWQLGAVALFSAIAAMAGPKLLSWRRIGR